MQPVSKQSQSDLDWLVNTITLISEDLQKNAVNFMYHFGSKETASLFVAGFLWNIWLDSKSN